MRLKTCDLDWIQNSLVRLVKLCFALLIVTLGMVGQVKAADEYWRTDGNSTKIWTDTSWNIGSATATGGTGWTSGNNAVFTAASALTFASSTVGNVTVNATTTISQAGTFSNGGTVSTFTVADGVTLTWTSQAFSTTAGTGLAKSGNGTWSIGSAGGSPGYPGGFTLNNGTIIVSGKYAFGSGALSTIASTISSQSNNVIVFILF